MRLTVKTDNPSKKIVLKGLGNYISTICVCLPTAKAGTENWGLKDTSLPMTTEIITKLGKKHTF